MRRKSQTTPADSRARTIRAEEHARRWTLLDRASHPNPILILIFILILNFIRI
jgi:hypothetical protein